jgi:hypothetical protein
MTASSKTLTWPAVAGFYEDLVRGRNRPIAPMLALVQFLAGSRYAATLFPRISDEVLCLGRGADFRPGEDELRIGFDGQTQGFVFTHFQRPDAPNPWSRECAAAEWRYVLERLLHKRLQWFHEG